MKNIIINIPSSSIDLTLYLYDGLYRENQLISKELDKDIPLLITFENDNPVNFKVKTTPFTSYKSFLPETKSNLYSILLITSILNNTEAITIHPKNDNVFVIRKVTNPKITLTTFTKKEDLSDHTNHFRHLFSISTSNLGADILDKGYDINISSAFNNNIANFGLGSLVTLISTYYPLTFAYSLPSGGMLEPNYVALNLGSSPENFTYGAFNNDFHIEYEAKDNTKLDGTYEDIAITPPNALIGEPNTKLIQVPLFTMEATYDPRFVTNDSKPLCYIYDFPEFDHKSLTIKKAFFGLEKGKKCVSYYPLTKNNLVHLAFFDKKYNTKNDKSASFYYIDLYKSTFGILMHTLSKFIKADAFIDSNIKNASLLSIPLDNVTGNVFKTWPSEKNGKPVHIIFLPDIKFKPKTATVDLRMEFICADKSLNVDDLKSALSLIMEDGEWKATLVSREYTGNIADVIP